MKAQILNYQKWIKDIEPKKIKKDYANILREAGFNIIDFMEHYFTPYGYTCLWLLAESHFAVHTFPEENKMYIELSSCNEEYFEKFKKKMEEYNG